MSLSLLHKEPPLLNTLNEEEICRFKEVPFKSDLPSSTQFLERLVQTVSKLGAVATEPKVRDGFVKATLHTQKVMERRETKEDFSSISKL